MKICLIWLAATIAVLASQEANAQNKRDIAVRADKQEFLDDDTWIYDDLDAAIVAATDTKRPLMIVFR